ARSRVRVRARRLRARSRARRRARAPRVRARRAARDRARRGHRAGARPGVGAPRRPRRAPASPRARRGARAPGRIREGVGHLRYARGVHADPGAAVVLAIAVILLAAKVGGDLMLRLGQPAVLGELLAGVVLGNLSLVGFDGFEYLKEDASVDMLARLG